MSFERHVEPEQPHFGWARASQEDGSINRHQTYVGYKQNLSSSCCEGFVLTIANLQFPSRPSALSET